MTEAILVVDEAEFWKWVGGKEDMKAYGIKRGWGDQISQRIRDFNWQAHQIEKAQQKMLNILNNDGYGKVVSAYLQDVNREFLGEVE